ncbi:HD domain-containing protein [Clostridium sp. Marseille-P2415]|uniref:HD domain-containing protein n=1 Tax=Clostridium sp. Marseille-P2415 TaxID=1805471 RepID=UPI0009885AF8|nr:HD domain-containing protein [Clostridium sp. Marseille-P2415]
MNRIEKVREYVDIVLLNMSDPAERRCGYLHLYGVSQACAMIAIKRSENVELATIAGMLHDIYSYSTLDTKDHAHKGSLMAREILNSLCIFDSKEIDMICSAIYNHSRKGVRHSSFDEVLIDADVMQHCLYNPLLDVAEHEKVRFENLKSEFGLQ